MKNKFFLFTALLVFALLSVACGAQDATSEPGATAGLPTVSTEAAGDAVTTPTGSMDGDTSTQGTGDTGATPVAEAVGGTPAAEAGGTASIPQTGPGDAGLPDDLDEAVRVLRTAGATVDLGGAVELESVPVPGQSLTIDGEDVQVFTFESAEELETLASQLANANDPEGEPEFYKMGVMLVRYAGIDPGVRDLLEDVLGAHAAGQ